MAFTKVHAPEMTSESTELLVGVGAQVCLVHVPIYFNLIQILVFNFEFRCFLFFFTIDKIKSCTTICFLAC